MSEKQNVLINDKTLTKTKGRRAFLSSYNSQVTLHHWGKSAETAAKAVYCLLACSDRFLIALRTNSLRAAPPTVCFARSLVRTFSQLRLFLPNDSSVCPGDVKQAYTSHPDAATYYQDGNLSLLWHEDPWFTKWGKQSHSFKKIYVSILSTARWVLERDPWEAAFVT